MNLRDEMMGDKDERMHLRDRGVGRDLGRNPAFDGTKQRGVTLPAHMDDAYNVGGAYERNQRVRSFAATTVGFGPVSGRAYEGAGALRGYTVRAIATGDTAIVNIYSGGSNIGALLASEYVLPATTHNVYFGDFGINVDSIYVEVLDVTTPGNLPDITGTLFVASVE